MPFCGTELKISKEKRKEITLWCGIHAISGGIKVANNLITTEEGFALDARQGKVLNENIIESANNLLKKIQASGGLSGNADWNNYTESGVYKVQSVNMTVENHAPVGIKAYGTLIVFRAEIGGENRMMQIYFPTFDPNLFIRSYNHPNWSGWYKIAGTML